MEKWSEPGAHILILMFPKIKIEEMNIRLGPSFLSSCALNTGGSVLEKRIGVFLTNRWLKL